MINTPYFLDRIADRWQESASAAAWQTIDRIYYMSVYYHDAFERNFERHPILGELIFPHRDEMVYLETFQDHVDYLIDFLVTRTIWLSDFFEHREFNEENGS